MTKFSFDKEAKKYTLHSKIQKQIAKDLILKSMDKDIKKILDLGAGSGNIALNLYKYDIDYFLGIDTSNSMLFMHKKDFKNIKNLELKNLDFNSFENYGNFDLIISSSSLHWAKDLESIFKKIKLNSSSHAKIAFSLFTNKSLESLHNFLGTISPLDSAINNKNLIEKYFIGEFEIKTIKKIFDTKHELLNHLKYSGLLGGGNLSFASKKKLKFDIPFLELNYEVLFFVGKLIKK